MTAVEYFLSLGYRGLSPYGERNDPFTGQKVFHYGYDFGVPDRNNPYNVPVLTPEGGVVRAVHNYTTTRGLTVSLVVNGVVFLFQHLASASVKPGDRLKRGDQVGIFGTTGRSTGIHLHFEIRTDDGSAIGRTPTIDPAKYILSQGGDSVKNIVISAGHGGSDTGARANGVVEKEINLVVAFAMRDYLNANYEGHKIHMPRTDDRFISLQARADFAGSVNADIYMSIHHNAFSDPSANGFDTHVSSRELKPQTLGYRKVIHDHVAKTMATLGVRDRGYRRTDHVITRIVPAPTIIMEYVFITNPREAELAKNPANLKLWGEATAEGVAMALDLKRKTTAPQPPKPPTALPQIQRTIGIEVDGNFVNEIGYLIGNKTYVRASWLLGLAGNLTVTGHGDHIKITRRGM